MTASGLFQIALYFLVLLALTKPLGLYMSRVFQGERTFMHRLVRPSKLPSTNSAESTSAPSSIGRATLAAFFSSRSRHCWSPTRSSACSSGCRGTHRDWGRSAPIRPSTRP